MRSLIALVVLSSTLVAQPTLLSGSFDQNPVAPGSTAMLRVSATAQVGLFTGCGLNAVRAGSPTGPIVFQPFICPLIFLSTGPGATVLVRVPTSDGRGNNFPAGTYFVEVGGTDNNGRRSISHFPFRIDDPAATPQANGPVLTGNVAGTTGPNPTAATGGTIDLTVSAPWAPGSVYFLACSSTTNVGIPVGSDFIALDPDLVFSLNFPTVLVPSVFQGFLGAIGPAGTASAAIVVPPAVLPQGFPLAVQGVVIDASGGAITNPVSISLR